MRASDSDPRPAGAVDLSVVIPSFHSVDWIESTLAALEVSIVRSPFRAHVVVVDDGSKDGTAELVESVAERFAVPLEVVVQENRGRFLARWTGAERARGTQLLLLDSRVLLDAGALAHVAHVRDEDPGLAVWNAHVVTDPAAPLVGRFWEVPTSLFWGDYLRDPRPMSITPGTFDRVPTGTTAFLLPTRLFVEACRAEWPDEDAALVSDDIRLLRWIVARTPIRLDPGFAATYRPRVRVGAFLRHSRDRGTLFVDSYAGTSALRNAILVILAALPPIVLVAVIALVAIGRLDLAIVLVAAAVACILAPAAVAGLRRVSARAIASYLVFVVPFGIVFWTGILRGVVLHRKAFGRSAPADRAA